MASNSLTKMHVLVVDDFNSFRITLNKIMYELGFRHVDSVGSGAEASAMCEKQHYDIILCDYNLGQGKNGQQLLEELRLKKLLKADDIFILLSADTSRQVVLSAYDCEPDAYLTKPITTKVIQQRLRRLLNQRSELLDINASLVKGDIASAIEALTTKINENSRYSLECQKLLAETYLLNNQLTEAEATYRNVLEMRPLDWAQVGLARVKIAQGEPAKAVKWLKDIIKAKPNCMKAYDVLTIALNEMNEPEELQHTLEQAVEISPMSVTRQVSLASTAMQNGDAEVAAQAYRKTIKFGANSHHDTADNQLNFAKAVARYYDNDPVKAGEMAKEATKMLSMVEEKYEVSPDVKLTSQLLGSQLYALQGDQKKSQSMLDIVEDSLNQRDDIDIDLEIELVNTFITNGEHDSAQKKIASMIERYRHDQQALEKIDPLLPEPVSERGKQRLIAANKQGIEAYKAMDYNKAVNYFIKLEKRYPRYIGVKLNLAQALIGRIRDDSEQSDIERCLTVFETVKRYIKNTDSQYNRYRQLQDMLRSIMNH